MEIEHTLWIKMSMRLITGNSNNFFTTPQLDTLRETKTNEGNERFKKKKKRKKPIYSFDREPTRRVIRWLLIRPSISHYRCLLIDGVISISDGNRVAGEATQGVSIEEAI